MKVGGAASGCWFRDAWACVRRNWPVLLVDFALGIEFSLTNLLIEPVLRTWVRCELEAAGGDAHLFSGSAVCGDRRYVIQQAARLNGWLGALEGSVSFFSMPLMGAFGDRYGRLPVLWTCIAGHAFWLLATSSSGGSAPVIVCAFFIRGLTGAFFSTLKSILGDAGGDRSLAYTVKNVFAAAGHGLGWLTALRILKLEMVDYAGVWRLCIGIFCVGTLVATQIPESLPSRRKDAAVRLSLALDPVRFLLREPFMVRWCAAKFFIFLGLSVSFLLRSFVLAAFKWRQGRFEALMGFAGGLAAVSTICAPSLIRRFSTHTVASRSALLAASCSSILVFAPLGPAFCLLPLMAKASGACGYTAATTLLADQYVADQGKSQSIVIAVCHAATTMGHLLYATLFDAHATSGLVQARPFIVAAPLTWIGYAFMLAALAVRKQSGPKAEVELVL
mmetsp:Transcript_106418/g.338903  ORF Transcript_106418/g.338903 Transcript_106418/m.338903 type:complete len:447 (+) Transcript_106418:99-1439(+)